MQFSHTIECMGIFKSKPKYRGKDERKMREGRRMTVNKELKILSK